MMIIFNISLKSKAKEKNEETKINKVLRYVDGLKVCHEMNGRQIFWRLA